MPWIRLVVPGEDRSEYLEGARAWESLGFNVELENEISRDECQRHWYTGERACQLTIGIVVEPELIARTGSDAASRRDERAVFLDDAILAKRTQLLIAVAHEIGHIVLDTREHTRGGVMGGATWTLRDADFELACRTISVCR